ncbi:MAG: 5'/3'-nucleotidase SurE [Prevotella sp.]|uniref:5'/3'-nucleotidase SurE n=1 Tax=Prevotella sp. TaxID=59823 RepID=UPI001CB5DD6D|nr:5'/3'-nucleotidase SurE [Prevotella sp.]MBF1582030.1 5'/3'-nucleotidase SurE [Prevotella sp.]
MNSKKPLILISNDDGYHSNGIRTLVSFLTDFADVVVCAPEAGRSGFSRAFSVVDYLLLKRRHNIPDCEVWSCTGTPVDCVKLALDQILVDRKPDLILGGINHGDNSSVNNHYSGTMGIAYEGCMKYIPSIAFSSCDYDPNADLSYLRDYVRLIVKKVLADGLPKGVCLNVNFPKVEKFTGLKVCRMGWGSWIREVEACKHPRGFDYYWMTGHYRNDEPDASDNDQWALAHGYVTVTPSKIDVTDYEVLSKMKSWESL